MTLVESLERAAEALPGDADGIRPANGDPTQLLRLLDPDAAGRVLAWLLGHAPDGADELASAWLEDPAGAEVLSGLSEDSLPKAGRKVLRRAMHRARSRGLAVGAGEAAAPRVARLPSADDRIDAGYVSPFDPRGARLVYLVESRAAGGARVSEALLDLQRGIVDFQVYQAGRRQVREFLRDVTHRKRMNAVPVEPAAVRALIARHVGLQPEGKTLPRAFHENRSQVLKDADATGTPGQLARRALGSAEPEDAALEALLERIEQREIGPWPPSPEHLNTLVLAIRDDVMAVRDEKGEAEALAQLEVRLRELVETQYQQEMVEQLAERFDELAYLYWRSDEEALARACLATASQLRTEPSESPVAAALCRILGEALLADLRPQIAPESAAADTEHGEHDEHDHAGGPEGPREES